VLADNSLLLPLAAIRVAAIADRPVTLPPLSSATLAAWTGELQGPYPQKVRGLLLQMGDESLTRLLSFWDKLPELVGIWALSQGTEQGLDECSWLVRKIVKHENQVGLLKAALNCLSQLPHEKHDEALLSRLYFHGDTELRAAAIGAGSTVIDFSLLLNDHPPEVVRLAVISRMDRSGAANHVDLLIRFFEDQSWRVRARATDVLVKLAPASLPALRRVLTSSQRNAKVAAMQALLRLGKEDWIAAALL